MDSFQKMRYYSENSLEKCETRDFPALIYLSDSRFAK